MSSNKDIEENLKQEKQKTRILLEAERRLLERISELEVHNKEIEEILENNRHLDKEDSQVKEILKQTTASLEKKKQELENTKKELEKTRSINESEDKETIQENMLLREMVESQKDTTTKIQKKYYAAILMTAVALTIGIVSYSFTMANLIGEEFQVSVGPQTTGYTIQNLRGDTIDTHLSWRLVEGDILTINILNAEKYDPEVLEVIKKVILSEEVLEIDNSLLHKGPKGTTSLMYVGWQGAMSKSAESETQFHIPNKFNIIESKLGEGDITIELTNAANADGFAGWTTTIADESQNQILKSRITIFAANSLSLAELETITRHEMGHALGLAHSTAPEELMYPTIETNFPYISECSVDAMKKLYDGGKSSRVICET